MNDAPGADLTPGPDLTPAERVRRAAVTLAALSQDGLEYGVSEYDRDRYRKVGAVAADLLAAVTDRPAADWRLELGRDSGYATPKVDVRGALVDRDERILLMRERSDGRWSLPGGWADPLDPPAHAAEREIREETGYVARAVKLVGCWDRDLQGHTPPLPVHVYKLFFLCEPAGAAGEPDALETLEIGWFALDALPELSPGRITARQLERMIAHHRDPSLPTEFD